MDSSRVHPQVCLSIIFTRSLFFSKSIVLTFKKMPPKGPVRYLTPHSVTSRHCAVLRLIMKPPSQKRGVVYFLHNLLHGIAIAMIIKNPLRKGGRYFTMCYPTLHLNTVRWNTMDHNSFSNSCITGKIFSTSSFVKRPNFANCSSPSFIRILLNCILVSPLL